MNIKERKCGQAVREHSLFVIYFVSLVWLLLSCIYYAASARESLSFTQPLIVYGGALAVAYLAATFLFRSVDHQSYSYVFPQDRVRVLLVGLFILFVAVVVIHLTTLGHLPAWLAYKSNDSYEIARIRQEGYYRLAIWQRYASDYAIKGIGPILLVLAARVRSRFFYPALAVGLFYTTSLFVKANSVYLLLPLVFYFALSKRFIAATAIAFMMTFSVSLNWATSSPELRDDFKQVDPGEQVVPSLREEIAGPKWEIKQAEAPTSGIPGWSLLMSFRERLVIVPAQVTAQWYFQYEDASEREEGCGYRVLAKLLGCEYVHMPTKLYGIYHAELVQQRGLTGSLNTGSYMHDFGNFGYVGVIFGAVVFGILFTVVRFVCRSDSAFLALNLMPVLSLPEMPLSTVLNSGGWLLIIGVCIFLRYGGLRQEILRQGVEAKA